jgi:transposase
MNAYSEDLRERVVAVVETGSLHAQIAKLSAAPWPPSAATRVGSVRASPPDAQASTRDAPAHRCARARGAGSATQRPGHGCDFGRPLPALARDPRRVGERADDEPRSGAGGGLDPQKKSLSASEQDPQARTTWQTMAKAQLAAAELVFVDESGANRALCPLYGWAPKGARALGQAPRNRGPNTSLLAAMSVEGLVATMAVEGSTNKEVFLSYLENVLCPALRPGQVVIMDNLSVHKNEAVREQIEAAGCRLLFLPAYSPDFNPIENAFSKLKGFLRKAKARTQEALEAAIAAGLATITGQNARGWFKHCGFPIAQLP